MWSTLLWFYALVALSFVFWLFKKTPLFSPRSKTIANFMIKALGWTGVFFALMSIVTTCAAFLAHSRPSAIILEILQCVGFLVGSVPLFAMTRSPKLILNHLKPQN